MAKRGRPKKIDAKPKRGRPPKKAVKPIEAPAPIDPAPVSTEIQDRMMRYRRSAPCPECGARPVVCMMKRQNYAAFRCRQCGHRWEVG